MRIISGSFKGKKILTPKDRKTRPLKDLTKESIFNILKHSNKFEINLLNSTVLDLFCGVGSFGIECLSRGVKKVIFIENYKGVLPILKKNLINLKSVKNYNISIAKLQRSTGLSKLDKCDKNNLESDLNSFDKYNLYKLPIIPINKACEISISIFLARFCCS